MASSRASRLRSAARWSRASALLLFAAAVIAPPVVASAQPSAVDRQPSAADKETARSLMDQGVEREEAKDYANALKAYEGAHALMGLPMTGIAVARAQVGLGLLLEALDMAGEVNRMAPKPGETAAYGKARAEAAALEQRLVGRIPSVQVSVDRASEKVAITIDGEVLPAAAAMLPHKVNPGKHVITATAPGNLKASVEVTVPEGKVIPVILTLQQSSGAASGGTGDGSANGSGGPPRGTGGDSAGPSGKSGGLSPLVFIGFGVGAAGIVAGTVTGALSIKETSDLKTSCDKKTGTCPPNRANEISKATTLANISNVSFALGVAGAGVGVLGLFLSGSGDQKKPQGAVSGFHVWPVVGPGSISIVGAF